MGLFCLLKQDSILKDLFRPLVHSSSYSVIHFIPLSVKKACMSSLEGLSSNPVYINAIFLAPLKHPFCRPPMPQRLAEVIDQRFQEGPILTFISVLLTDRAAFYVDVSANTSFPYCVLFILPFIGFWMWFPFSVALCELRCSHWFHLWWFLCPFWLMCCSYVILKHIPKFVSCDVLSAYLWFPFVCSGF